MKIDVKNVKKVAVWAGLFICLLVVGEIAGQTQTLGGEIFAGLTDLAFLILMVALFWKVLKSITHLIFHRKKGGEEHRRGSKAATAEDLARMTQEKE
ncbi:hypothetical protein BJI67_12885 [Acidihalobacter aeolianus]|uniref:Uncharacterized protein n=1 Tax=Acidihalobacter aeolianus TaxID=2792603 RepID=A0A1D8KA61_9GAMM|nr:hypothetical protein [Acidihalobacter aeolianus]AOV17827.1 hypothetical protein BJI67_12885 [Acidihalobacter aeolianus]